MSTADAGSHGPQRRRDAENTRNTTLRFGASAVRLASVLYGRAASWRRSWYARHPDTQRRLRRPVISVGNLAVGGRGKTPLVAAIARWLQAQGEQPAILSRGYARRESTDGVLVVSDTTRVLEGVERSGDEPQMLARALPGVPVLVSADRYLAGTLAERAFGATVHVLDDGFQHIALARDVDLLIMAPGDFEDAVLPAGRLREPLAAMAAASVVIEAGDVDHAARTVAVREASHAGSPHGMSFRLETTSQSPRLVYPFGELCSVPAGARVVAVAGIARPERLFMSARERGWDVVKELVYRDHHWFTPAEVRAMLSAAGDAGADVVLTTEKDACRLAPLVASLSDSRARFVYLPIAVTVEPQAEFFEWLRARLEAARA